MAGSVSTECLLQGRSQESPGVHRTILLMDLILAAPYGLFLQKKQGFCLCDRVEALHSSR